MFLSRNENRKLAGLLAGAALGALIGAMPANAQIQLPPVSVEGSAAGSYQAQTPGLSKLTEPVLDTPVSIDTITSQVMQDRGETTLNDALRNAPGITLTAGEFNWEGNAPYIRGFSARTDMFVDGMRDIGNYFRDPFDLEKVEVLEGPDSVLFGRGSTGGVINQVTKRPMQDPLTSASASFGTDDTKRVTVDWNVPLDGLGAPAALRINAMGNSSGVAGRDAAHNDRYGFAGSLAMELGSFASLDVSYFHQSEDDQPDYGLPWYFGRPAPVDRNVYYGYRDADYQKLQADIVTAEAVHDFGDGITLSERARFGNYTRNVHIAKAMEPAGLTTATPLSSILVSINSYTLDSTEQQIENQTDLTARFQTGALTHAVVAGIEYDDESSDPNYYNSAGQPPKSLVAPDETQIFNPTSTYPRAYAVTHASTAGAYVMDTIEWGDQFQAVLGVRWDSIAASFRGTTFSVPPAATGVITGVNNQHRVDGGLSPRASLIYKPVPEATLYFSYGTSFNPTAEALNFINSGENFNVANEHLAPEKNRNFEAGVKWQVLDDQLLLTGAIFRSEKYNARIPDPANPGFNQLAGDQRVDGFELQARGAITPDWNLTAGYDYLNSDTIKSVAGGPPLGFALPFTPRSNVTLWTTYNITPEFQVGAGGQYVGARYAQVTAPVEQVPGYIVVDAMARYRLSEKFDVQLNVYNIGDKYYYDLLHPAFVVPGAGRSALLTLNYHL